MAKDPAFLFYPGDWLGGTMTFSRSHKGAYMDLLMAQFNNGHMCLDDIKTVLGPDFELMWEQKLKNKFKIDENGCYYNEKLENEVIKRRNFTESRRKNLSQVKTHKKKHKNSHMDNHMENENENINKKNKIGKKKFKPPTEKDVIKYFKENGYKIEVAKRAFKFYNEADPPWTDTNGKKIRGWKQKMIGVWFKDENKTPPSESESVSCTIFCDAGPCQNVVQKKGDYCDNCRKILTENGCKTYQEFLDKPNPKAVLIKKIAKGL